MDRVATETFRKIEKASSWAHRRTSDVFDDWLMVLEGAIKNAPHVHAWRVDRGHAPVQAEEALKAREILSTYSPEAGGILAESVGEFIVATYADGDPDYIDRLGMIYMMVGGNKDAGQFFTPWDICKVMAKVKASSIEQVVDDRMMAALDRNFMTSSLGVASVYERCPELRAQIALLNLPLVRKDFEPVTILDCCVGSGGLLLAIASELPRWMTQYAAVKFFAQDSDHRCCQMTRINFMMYGVGQPCPIGPLRETVSTKVSPIAATTTDFIVEHPADGDPSITQLTLFEQ